MKKLIKKIPPIMIICILTVGFLTGCGEKESQWADQYERTELTISWWGNETRNRKTLEMLDLYQKERDNISFGGQFFEWEDYWKKLASAAAGNELPDIIQMDYKYLSQYVEKGLLLDLQPYVENGELNLDECPESAVASGRLDGGLYAVCSGMTSPALFYNKTLLNEAGIEIGSTMTIDEFKEICREVYSKTGVKTNINLGNNEQFLEYMLRAQDIVLYEEDGLGGDSSQSYIDFFRLYEEGIQENWHVGPEIFTERVIGSVEQDPMIYGESPGDMSWCAFQYASMYPAVSNAVSEKFEIGIACWPSDNIEKSNYLKPSMFWAVTKDCKNPEEAVQFIDYYTNSVECQKINEAERGIPLSEAVITELKTELGEDTQKYIQFVQNIVSISCSDINPPLPLEAAEVNVLLNQLEMQVCYKNITAAEAGRQFWKTANEILGKNKYQEEIPGSY